MKYNLILANKSQQVFLGVIPLDSSSERLLSVTVTMVMSIPLISHFLGLFLVNLSCPAPAHRKLTILPSFYFCEVLKQQKTIQIFTSKGFGFVVL